MKLQSKILITIFSALFVVTAITLIAYYTIEKNETIKEALKANEEQSRIISAEFDRLEKEWASTLTYLQNHRIFTEYLEAKASGGLKTHPEKRAAFEGLLLSLTLSRPELIKQIRFIDKNGMEEVIVKNREIKKNYTDQSTMANFSEVIKSPSFELSRPGFKKENGSVSMDRGMAVSYGGKISGVLIMTLNTVGINRIFDSLLIKGFVDNVYVTTLNGTYLLNTRYPEKVFAQTAIEHAKAFDGLMSGDTGAVVDTVDEEVMSFSTHAPLGIRFMLGTNKATIMAQTVTLLKRVVLLLFLSLIPLGFVVAFLIKKMIVKRLQLLSNAMKRVSSVNSNNVNLTSTIAIAEVEALAFKEKDELGDLSRSFITMSDKLSHVREKLNTELQRLQGLVRFGRLVGDEISEQECYSILIKYLSEDFKIDKMVVVSLNNSEDITEVVATYSRNSIDGCLETQPCGDINVTQNKDMCRAVRSGGDFIVTDVKTEYRCPNQEVEQSEGSYMCTPISTGGSTVGWVHLVSTQTNFFTPECCFIINSYLSTIAPAISNMRLIKAHRSMAIRDQLTGLYNRRFLEESLTSRLAYATRFKQPISLVMIDIDHFKRFNDLYGHKRGDDIIQKVSNLFLENIRESDIVARYGGEEFVIILPNTDKNGARVLAEKIRSKTEAGTVTNLNGVMERTTISLGVSTFPEDATDKAELMRQVDVALYRSKTTGRNKVSTTSLLVIDNSPPTYPAGTEKSTYDNVVQKRLSGT